MTLKILVVIGSPHKGETFAVIRRVEEAMARLGDVEFDELWLKDVNLGQCVGCHACIRFGAEKCPLKNDLAAIEARMRAADGLILASPVYCLQVTALLKTFIDLLAYRWHRPGYFGKFAMGISSGGGQFKETLQTMKQNSEMWGYTYVTGLGAAHPEALVPKMKQKLEEEIQQAAEKFYNALAAKRVPSPSLYRLIMFRVWRINAQACKVFNPSDYSAWVNNGWFKQDYYDPTIPINPVKRLVARLMEPVLRRFLRGVYVGY